MALFIKILYCVFITKTYFTARTSWACERKQRKVGYDYG